MNDNSADTIAAIATAAGAAAVALVRVSGPRAIEVAESIAGGALTPRMASVRTLRTQDAQPIDEALVLSFPAPHSYTGEHVVEFQVHGSAVVTDWLMEALHSHGVRSAQPGEFTLRAYLNDKLDLAQAEAVADLIASQSRESAGAALRSLEGRFSAQVNELQSQLTAARVHLEAHLDFPDEDIDPAQHAAIVARLDDILAALTQLYAQAQNGVVLRDGLSVAIAGPPNAGKSSLLNSLAGYDAAIVTDVPGTTRDPLREQIVLDGLPVQIVDTAGLRDTLDPIEREGTRRATAEAHKADRILWLFDAREGEAAARVAAAQQFPDADNITIVLNKIDLCAHEDSEDAANDVSGRHAATAWNVADDVPPEVIRISALTGTGIDTLIAALRHVAGWRDAAQGTFSARRRHLDALSRARASIESAKLQLTQQSELAAEELRQAQTALSELTGELSSDDLLGEIFSNFCIGK